MSANVKHGGGLVGAGGALRSGLNPMLFGAAPRYHGGGIAGLAPDEVPAVLQRGEEVLTKRDPRHRKYWDAAFTLGSIVAAFAQGVTLGGLLQGISVDARSYSGGWWDWLSPFSLLVGVALVCGYALLGATWLIMKSEGSLLDHCYRLALRFAVSAAELGLVSGVVASGAA